MSSGRYPWLDDIEEFESDDDDYQASDTSYMDADDDDAAILMHENNHTSDDDVTSSALDRDEDDEDDEQYDPIEDKVNYTRLLFDGAKDNRNTENFDMVGTLKQIANILEELKSTYRRLPHDPLEKSDSTDARMQHDYKILHEELMAKKRMKFFLSNCLLSDDAAVTLVTMRIITILFEDVYDFSHLAQFNDHESIMRKLGDLAVDDLEPACHYATYLFSTYFFEDDLKSFNLTCIALVKMIINRLYGALNNIMSMTQSDDMNENSNKSCTNLIHFSAGYTLDPLSPMRMVLLNIMALTHLLDAGRNVDVGDFIKLITSDKQYNLKFQSVMRELLALKRHKNGELMHKSTLLLSSLFQTTDSTWVETLFYDENDSQMTSISKREPCLLDLLLDVPHDSIASGAVIRCFGCSTGHKRLTTSSHLKKLHAVMDYAIVLMDTGGPYTRAEALHVIRIFIAYGAGLKYFDRKDPIRRLFNVLVSLEWYSSDPMVIQAYGAKLLPTMVSTMRDYTAYRAILWLHWHYLPKTVRIFSRSPTLVYKTGNMAESYKADEIQNAIIYCLAYVPTTATFPVTQAIQEHSIPGNTSGFLLLLRFLRRFTRITGKEESKFYEDNTVKIQEEILEIFAYSCLTYGTIPDILREEVPLSMRNRRRPFNLLKYLHDIFVNEQKTTCLRKTALFFFSVCLCRLKVSELPSRLPTTAIVPSTVVRKRKSILPSLNTTIHKESRGSAVGLLDTSSADLSTCAIEDSRDLSAIMPPPSAPAPPPPALLNSSAENVFNISVHFFRTAGILLYIEKLLLLDRPQNAVDSIRLATVRLLYGLTQHANVRRILAHMPYLQRDFLQSESLSSPTNPENLEVHQDLQHFIRLLLNRLENEPVVIHGRVTPSRILSVSTEENSIKPLRIIQWNKNELNEIVHHYLWSHGYFHSAYVFKKEAMAAENLENNILPSSSGDGSPFVSSYKFPSIEDSSWNNNSASFNGKSLGLSIHPTSQAISHIPNMLNGLGAVDSPQNVLSPSTLLNRKSGLFSSKKRSHPPPSPPPSPALTVATTTATTTTVTIPSTSTSATVSWSPMVTINGSEIEAISSNEHPPSAKVPRLSSTNEEEPSSTATSQLQLNGQAPPLPSSTGFQPQQAVNNSNVSQGTTLVDIVSSFLEAQHVNCSHLSSATANGPISFSLKNAHSTCPASVQAMQPNLHFISIPDCIQTFRTHGFLQSRGARRRMRQFNYSKFSKYMELRPEDTYVRHMVFTPSNSFAYYCVTNENECFYWNEREFVSLPDIGEACSFMNLSNNGQLLAISGAATVNFYNVVDEGQSHRSWKSINAVGNEFVFNNNGLPERMMLTGTRTCDLWDINTSQRLMVLKPPLPENCYWEDAHCQLSYCDRLALWQGTIFDLRLSSSSNLSPLSTSRRTRNNSESSTSVVAHAGVVHKLDKLQNTSGGIFHPNEREVVCSDYIFDLRNLNHLLCRVPLLENYSPVFTADGSCLIAAPRSFERDLNQVSNSFDCTFRTFDADTYEPISKFPLRQSIGAVYVDHQGLTIGITTKGSLSPWTTSVYEVGISKATSTGTSVEEDDEDAYDLSSYDDNDSPMVYESLSSSIWSSNSSDIDEDNNDDDEDEIDEEESDDDASSDDDDDDDVDENDRVNFRFV